ncbi:MAG: hypothetical protein PHU54_08360 [Candidatus Omnitrophica bacterium]|nr:hypothetical protein [Candidatus Omnitrophota bacterium]
MTDEQPNYLCNDDDLNSLTDYFNAALAGEESKSRLQQMWEQEIGIIKATGQDKKKQSMSDRYKDEEPDLTPISNCIKKEPIVITPKICTLFWNYRADSGHLYHLLFDLVGEEFVTSHELMDSIMKVLDEWQTPEEKQKHDTAIRNAVLDELGILHGEDAKRFNEQLNHPEPLTPEARDLVARAKEIAKKERMALDYSERIRDLEEIISLSEKLLHQFPDDFSLKMSMQQASQELKRLESLRSETANQRSKQ